LLEILQSYNFALKMVAWCIRINWQSYCRIIVI